MALPLRLWFGREWTLSQELHHIGAYQHRANQRVSPRMMTFHEIVLVARGSLHLRVDGRARVVLGGQIAAVPSGASKEIDGGLSRGRYLWIGIGDERHRTGPGLPQLDDSERDRLAVRLCELNAEVQTAPPGLLAACDGLLTACVARSAPARRRAAALAVLAELLEPSAAVVAGDARLRPARELIERDPVAAAATSLPALAAMCGLGLTSFKRCWLASTGLSPGDDITRRRLALAEPHLTAGIGVTEVAAALGYASPRAFRAAWKRLHGVGPGIVRPASE